MSLEVLGDDPSRPRKVLDGFVERYALGEYSVLDEGDVLTGEGEGFTGCGEPSPAVAYYWCVFLH